MPPTIVLVHGAFADSASCVRAIDGPVLLVAHSYGGAVISNVAADAGDITGLVYVNGFAPDSGENCFALAGMFPGSMVGEETVWPVPRSDGTTDFYIAPDSFHEVFCADVPAAQAALMATTQRPATQEALVEPSGDHRRVLEIPGASHAAAVSQPDATAQLILEAAAAPVRAAA